MSEGFAPPPETAYITATPFDMPTPDGNIWAISFTTASAQFLNGAIAVIFTLIFPCEFPGLLILIYPNELSLINT